MNKQLWGAFAAIGAVYLSAIPAYAAETAVYVAILQPMNSNVAGSPAAGEARLSIDGDTLTIELNVQRCSAWCDFTGSTFMVSRMIAEHLPNRCRRYQS